MSIKATERLLERKRKRSNDEGVVVSKAPGGVMVRLSGSSNTQWATVGAGYPVEPGDRVFLSRSDGQRHWVVTGVSNPSEIGRIVATQGFEEEYEIAPPRNIRQIGVVIPEAAVIQWDAPGQQAVMFEVQMSATATEGDATTALTTRGSYAILHLDAVMFFRLRSEGVRARSSWSQWHIATPGQSAGSTALSAVLFYYGTPLSYNGNFLTHT